MPIPSFTQDPDARLDYELNWADFLGTDTITDSAWASSDPALIVENGTFDDTTTRIWVRGGAVAASYLVTNHITTAGGRENDQTIKVKIKEQ